MNRLNRIAAGNYAEKQEVVNAALDAYCLKHLCTIFTPLHLTTGGYWRASVQLQNQTVVKLWYKNRAGWQVSEDKKRWR